MYATFHLPLHHLCFEHRREYRIRNECVRDKVEVALIEDKVGKSLRWSVRIRRPSKALVRRVDHVKDSPIVRGRGRETKKSHR